MPSLLMKPALVAALPLFLLLSCSKATTPNDPADADSMPAGDDRYKVRIVALVPHVNDHGDSAVENWTIRNFDTQSVDMAGWTAVDPEAVRRYTWKMDTLGVLPPGASRTYTSTASAQLNNGGDDLQLVAPDGTIVQVVTFGSVRPGEVVLPR